jgi:hypothetical protein
MVKHRFTQFGTVSVAIMGPIFVFCLVLLLKSGSRDPNEAFVLGFVALTMLICLLIFYKLTIVIDDGYFSFSLGLGLISKKYPIGEIKSCTPVKNFFLTGIGIRMLPNGWLYNVSGLGAVELSFKNKKSIVRIGTNDPEAVSQVVNELIRQEIHGSGTYENESKGFYSIVLFIFALLVPVIIIFSGNGETVVKSTKNDFTLKGMYGMTIRYDDILLADTLSNLPGILLRTNGFAFGKTLKGNFMLRDNSRARLFIRKENPPYINFKTKDLSVWINFKDPEQTRKFYNQIKTEK